MIACAALGNKRPGTDADRRMGDRLIETASSLRYGDVADLSNFGGAVIDRKAFARNAAALDGLEAAFNLSALGTGFNVGAILLGCAVGAFIAGRLADAIGRRTVMQIAAALFIALLALQRLGEGDAERSREIGVRLQGWQRELQHLRASR